MVSSFFYHIHAASLHGMVEDKLCCRFGDFVIFCDVILHITIGWGIGEVPSWRDLDLRGPLRVCFFTWKAIWQKILTVNQLMKRGWPLANRCIWCNPARLERSQGIISLFTVTKLICCVILGCLCLFFGGCSLSL